MKTLLWSLFLFFVVANLQGQDRVKLLIEKASQSTKSGENGNASKYLLQAIEEAKKSKQFTTAANIMTSLASVYYGEGAYKKASDICLEGIQLYSQKGLKADTVLFKLYAAQAPCLKNQYLAREALDSYFNGNNLIAENSKIQDQIPLYVAYHYYNQGVFLLKIFDLYQAKVNFERALEMGLKLKDSELILDCMISLSSIYSNEEDVEGALKKIKNVLPLVKKYGQMKVLDMARSDYLIASLYHKMNRNAESEKYLDQVLSKAKILQSSNEGKSIFIQSIYLKAITNPANSHFYLNKISGGGYIPEYLKADYFITLAQIEFYRKNFSSAVLKYQEALKILEVSFNPKTKKWEGKDLNKAFHILTKISLVQKELYAFSRDKKQLKLALQTVKNALEVANEIRANYFTFEAKLFFSEQNYMQYKHGLSLLYELQSLESEQNEQNELFYLAENSKSYMMNLYQVGIETKRSSKQDSLNLKLSACNSYIAHLKNKNALPTEILDFEQKANLILKELKGLNSSQNVISQRNGFNFENLKKINSDQLYVNYILEDKRLLIICVSRTGIRSKQVTINTTTFNYHKTNLKKALITPPFRYAGFAESESCEYFYKLLIENLPLPISKFKRLAINPDNNLFDFSFDVLQNPANKRYLIEDVAISYVSSIEDMLQKKYPSIKDKCNIFLPFANEDNILLENLQPLRFSLNKSKGILANFFLDKEANKLTFLQKLHEPLRISILSTHASAKEKVPYLVFDEEGKPNSRLYASEIPYLSINSPLVILNACESGLGRKVNGMGMFSLAESFRLAGGKAILGSMWQADEESTALISSLFYRNIMKGMPKDVALQQAKLDFLSTEVGQRNDLPFYWSHLQLMGDTSPIQSNKNYYLIVLGVLFLLLYVIFKTNLSKKVEI